MFEIGLRLLHAHADRMLDPENAPKLEAVFYACLECGRTDWARTVFNMLKQHGAGLPKTLRLEALLLNAEEKPRDAYNRLYSILKAVPTDTQTWKVLISIKQVSIFVLTILCRPMVSSRRRSKILRGTC